MRHLKLWILALALMATMLGLANADDLFVKSKKGEIKKKPRGSAKTVTTAKFGAKLAKSKKKKKWYQVAYKGKKGWIYKGSVSKSQPEKDPSLSATDGGSLSSEEVDASSAVRGVGPNASGYANRGGIKPVHRKFIDYHQSYVVSDRVITELPKNKQVVTKADIEAFMKEGKLGAYAD